MAVTSQDALGELSNLMKSNGNLVQIVSHEWERVVGVIVNAIRQDERKYPSEKEETRRRYLRYTPQWGMTEWDWENDRVLRRDDLPEDSKEYFGGQGALVCLKRYLGWENETLPGFPNDSVLHIEDLHHHLITEPPSSSRKDWIDALRAAARLNQMGKEAHMIIIGSTRRVHPQELDKEVPTIVMDLPNLEDLETLRESVVSDFNLKHGKKDDSPRILEAALGLSIQEAEMAFAKAIAATGQLTEEEVDLIHYEKKQIIDRTGILEYYTGTEDWDKVKGLEEMKRWLKSRRGSFFAEASSKTGLPHPKGALLLGVPGCGKSMTAKAVSNIWGFPLLRFDIGRVFGSLQGQSEQRIREALAVAEAVSPCILWIDEIEKGLAGMESSGRTDGGTTARVIGTFLTWMQEKTKPVFVLATSNDISKLPPEMLRKGRFDEIFFVDLPTTGVRAQIFSDAIEEFRRLSNGKSYRAKDFEIAKLSSKEPSAGFKGTGGFSGAEVFEAVVDAMHQSSSEGRDMGNDDIFSSVEKTQPLSRIERERIGDLREAAIARFRMASDDSEELPEVWKEEEEKNPIPRLRSERIRPFSLAGEDPDE